MVNFGHFATFPIFSYQVVQSDSEWPILQLSQYFPTKVVKLIQNGQFWLFCNFSNIFLLKWSELIWNGKVWLFCNFSCIFLLQWSKLIWNGQFGLLASFLIFSHQSALKSFEIATKVFRTYNFTLNVSFQEISLHMNHGVLF